MVMPIMQPFIIGASAPVCQWAIFNFGWIISGIGTNIKGNLIANQFNTLRHAKADGGDYPA